MGSGRPGGTWRQLLGVRPQLKFHKVLRVACNRCPCGLGCSPLHRRRQHPSVASPASVGPPHPAAQRSARHGASRRHAGVHAGASCPPRPGRSTGRLCLGTSARWQVRAPEAALARLRAVSVVHDSLHCCRRLDAAAEDLGDGGAADAGDLLPPIPGAPRLLPGQTLQYTNGDVYQVHGVTDNPRAAGSAVAAQHPPPLSIAA